MDCIAYLANVGQFNFAILVQAGYQVLHFLVYHTGGVREVGVIDSHIRLYQKPVVHFQLRVETNGTGRGKENVFFLYISSRIVMSDKASKIGNNDAIILQ